MSHTQLLLTENQTTTSISLVLHNEDIQKAITILVAHQIPFQLNFNQKGDFTVSTTPVVTNRLLKSTFSKPSYNDLINKIYHKYINNEFKSPIPTEIEITNEFGLSIGTFRKIFKNKYGSTFLHLYMIKRMEKAQELLRQGLSCREVARQVGYGPNSDIKFNKMFQKYVGITPKKYQLLEAFK